MQSKQISLNLTPSKLPVIGLLLIFICGYAISHYLAYLRYSMFAIFAISCLFWLYKYLSFKNYNIVINTRTNEIKLNHIPVQIIKFKHITWWFDIIYLSGEVDKIYLFADSVPFKTYKSFKIFSQWI